MKSQTSLLYCLAMNIVLFEGSAFFPRSDDRYQHIRKVLKKGKGDTFAAGIVDGPEGTATITGLDDAGLSFDFHEERPMRPLYPITILIGFPRPIQLKRIFRDVASLGVASVWLVGTELGEKSYRESSLVDRGAARTALVDGAMQAGSSAVPELNLFDSVPAALDALAASDGAVRVLLDTLNPDCTLIDAPLDGISKKRPLVLAIGSERGWTANERKLFREEGFVVCSMGSRILRTETACTAALGIALARSGLMDGNQ